MANNRIQASSTSPRTPTSARPTGPGCPPLASALARSSLPLLVSLPSALTSSSSSPSTSPRTRSRARRLAVARAFDACPRLPSPTLTWSRPPPSRASPTVPPLLVPGPTALPPDLARLKRCPTTLSSLACRRSWRTFQVSYPCWFLRV